MVFRYLIAWLLDYGFVYKRDNKGRRGQACDLLFACFPFLPKPDMVDPGRPQARRVQAGADRELGRSAFNHLTGVGANLDARGVFVLLLHPTLREPPMSKVVDNPRRLC